MILAHTLGNPFDLEAVTEFAQQHDLWLIEDCCDAVGSTYQGRKVGTFGDLATTSFYPAHHITMGEGGAVLTDKPLLRTMVESLPRLGPRLLVRSPARTTPAASASTGSWATCPAATTTSTPTRTSATT